MPGFDGTGPMGQGSMTGGGRGYCAVNLNDAGVRRGPGRGFFAGGNGRGRRNCFYAAGMQGWMRAQKGMSFGLSQGGPAFGGSGSTISKEEDLSLLKAQADYLKAELEAVQTRVQDLEAQ